MAASVKRVYLHIILTLLILQCLGSIVDILNDCDSRSTCIKYRIPGDVKTFFSNYTCFCGADCETFGDCCYDVNITREVDKSYRCLNVPEIDDQQFVRLVDACPKHWSDDWTISQCQNSDVTDEFLRIPARGIRTGRNYRNMFCALCHGENARIWRVQVHCKRTKYLNIIHFTEWNQTERCSVMFKPPLGHSYRPCLESVESCANSYNNSKLTYLCGNEHTSYVYYNKVTYKNAHCARCHDINVKDLTCTRPPNRGRSRKASGIYPFAILMDMNTGTYESRVKNRVSRPVSPTRFLRCGAGMIYDHFNGNCRRSWCRRESVFFQGKCKQPMRLNTSRVVGKTYKTVKKVPNVTNCVWIKLNKSEIFEIRHGMLYVKAHAKSYNRSFYEFDSNNSVLVCVDFKQRNNTDSGWNFSDAQSYVTVIGLVLSIIALTIQLIIYSILSPLRNVPGKNLMHLSASLLIADIAFLISPQLEFQFESCVTLSIVVHMSFLLSFFWMNAMSFDIWYTFRSSSVRIHSKRGTFKRHISYVVYVWSTSLLIMIAALLVDFTSNDSDFKPSYGMKRCWINNPMALAMFFIAPLSLLFMANIAFYVMTVVSIVRVDRSTRIAAETGSERHRYFLYIKLCTIMGLTWIFGFLGAFTGFTVFWYFFTVLNSLQGLFICASFVFNKNVYRLLQEKFGEVPYKETSSSVQTGSSSLKGHHLTLDKGRNSTDLQFCQEGFSCDSMERFKMHNKE